MHYYGVLGPHSGWRGAVVPEPEGQRTGGDEEQRAGECRGAVAAGSRPRADRDYRMKWAELLKRTFGVDGLACSCGGRLKLKWLVHAPAALAAIARSVRGGAGASGGDGWAKSRAGPQRELVL